MTDEQIEYVEDYSLSFANAKEPLSGVPFTEMQDA